jgi:hypothetical protein
MSLVKAAGRNYLAGEFDWVGAVSLFLPFSISISTVVISPDHVLPCSDIPFLSISGLMSSLRRRKLNRQLTNTLVTQSGGDPLASFLSKVEESGFAGDFYWSLFGHDDQCCQYVGKFLSSSLYHQSPPRAVLSCSSSLTNRYITSNLCSFLSLSEHSDGHSFYYQRNANYTEKGDILVISFSFHTHLPS